jgi:uncharacterized protein (TIGR00730 family)
MGAACARLGFTVMTGGGPGIMQAGTRAAYEIGGRSIGINIELPFEQDSIPTSSSITMRYFFTRKVVLVKYSYAFIVMPGGAGTLDEMFETMTLIQTGKLKGFPIILMGKDYWQPLMDFVYRMAEEGTISPDDPELIFFTDDIEDAAAHLKRHAVRQFGLRKKRIPHPIRALGEKPVVTSASVALGEVGVGIDTAVAEEMRPDAAEILDDAPKVEVVVEDFLVFGGGLGDDFAVGIGDERAAPELGSVVGAAAVDGGEVAAVGDGVAALDGFPGAVLGLAESGFFLGQPADGGGVDEDLRAAESHQTGGFRIPLVPADQHAEFPELRLPDRPAAVAGGEIEFFLETGVLRDVGFPIEAQQRAVCVVDGGGVVIEPGPAVLEQRGNEHDAQFARERAQAVGHRPGQGIGEIEQRGSSTVQK